MFEEEKRYCLEKLGYRYCVSYKVFTKEGKPLDYGHTACYAGISTDRTEGCFVINRIQKNYAASQIFSETSEEDRIAYLSWLMNESPFAESFISKDAKECLDEGLIINTCDVDGRILVGGMTAMRGMWEGGNTCNLGVRHFRKLIEAGCEPHIAFILGHFVNGGMTFNTYGAYGSHCSIEPSTTTVGYVKNFLAHKKESERDPFYKNSNYRGIHTLWNSSELRKSFGTYFSKLYKKCNKKQEEVAGEINPFDTSRRVSGIHVTYEGLAKTSDEFIKEIQ